MKKLTHVEARARWEQMREYYRDGHTQREVAEKFGTTRDYAKNICKGIRPGNQYTNGLFDREANAKKYVEKIGGYEYAGNFTGVDGFVDIRCKTCGHIQRKSMVSIRHKRNTTCPVCAENAKKKAKEAGRERKKREKFLSQKFTQVEFRTCPVCNSVFVGSTKYCSTHCRENNKWRLKDGYRHSFPLTEVYERDNGVCYLCGGLCDWDDYEERDGVIVYGNMYPSRDHMIPKSRGGANTWENIRLAHRICNSLKKDRPLVKKDA